MKKLRNLFYAVALAGTALLGGCRGFDEYRGKNRERYGYNERPEPRMRMFLRDTRQENSRFADIVK